MGMAAVALMVLVGAGLGWAVQALASGWIGLALTAVAAST